MIININIPSVSNIPTVEVSVDNSVDLHGNRSINNEPKMEWKPVTVPFDRAKYCAFTLVKVRGWSRHGIAHFFDLGWNLNFDPSIELSKSKAEITHWLAVPVETITL